MKIRPAAALSLLIAVSIHPCLAQTADPAATTAARGAQSQNLSAWLQYIALELKTIRLELIEERSDKQQVKLSELERELQVVRDQQRNLEEEQNSEMQEPNEIDVQLAQPGLSKEGREELEARKADLLGAGTSRFASARAALAQRENQARDRIAAQQERMQLLAQQAQSLAPTSK